MSLNENQVTRALIGHAGHFWPDRTLEVMGFSGGAIAASLPGFTTMIVAPTRSGEEWIYLSNGAWRVQTRTGNRIEFFLLSPTRDAGLSELLAMVANFHADKRFEVEIGKVISIGRPWLDSSLCDHLLVSLPYPFGPDFETVIVDSVHIRILWLLPITAHEAAYARKHGYQALEELFEQSAFDTLDPARRSVI